MGAGVGWRGVGTACNRSIGTIWSQARSAAQVVRSGLGVTTLARNRGLDPIQQVIGGNKWTSRKSGPTQKP